MPYLKITFAAPDPVWVKITDETAAAPECWDELCSYVTWQGCHAEAIFGEAVASLPTGARLRTDLT